MKRKTRIEDRSDGSSSGRCGRVMPARRWSGSPRWRREKLDSAAAVRIRTHAASCARCQAEIRLAEAFLDGEPGAAGDDPDPEVGAVVEALAAPTARWRRGGPEIGSTGDLREPARPQAQGPASPRWYWRIAAVLAVLVGGVLFLVDAPPELLPPPDPTSAVRGSGLELLEPQGRVEEVPAELSWVPLEDAAAYEVEVRRIDGSVVWSGTVSAPPATLPAPAREGPASSSLSLVCFRARPRRPGHHRPELRQLLPGPTTGPVMRGRGGTVPRSDCLPSIVAALVLAAGLAAVPAAAQEEPLTLRVNDARAVPGGVVAVVVRTYESLPIGQGQACFRFRRLLTPGAAPLGGGQLPFGELLGARVFSAEGDAQYRLSPEPGADGFLLEFLSLSDSINESDGPIAVIYFRLRSDLAQGQTFELALDLADTVLFDEDGQPIPIETRAGELQVVAPGSPFEVEADGDEVAPGRWAEVTYETARVRPLSEGRVTLLYDPAIAAGDPRVLIAPRIGRADYRVDASVPGRVEVRFSSPDGSLNRLPGSLIRFAIPTRADVPLGTESPVSFEAETSWLEDLRGDLLEVAYEGDVIEFALP